MQAYSYVGKLRLCQAPYEIGRIFNCFFKTCFQVLDLLSCTVGLVTDFVCSTLGLVTDSVCLKQGGLVTSLDASNVICPKLGWRDEQGWLPD